MSITQQKSTSGKIIHINRMKLWKNKDNQKIREILHIDRPLWPMLPTTFDPQKKTTSTTAHLSASEEPMPTKRVRGRPKKTEKHVQPKQAKAQQKPNYNLRTRM